MAGTKNFRELTRNFCCDEALQNNVCDKVFFKKITIHFGFLLIRKLTGKTDPHTKFGQLHMDGWVIGTLN